MQQQTVIKGVEVLAVLHFAARLAFPHVSWMQVDDYADAYTAPVDPMYRQGRA